MIRLNPILFILLSIRIHINEGQMLVPPGPEVQDPFKDNSKWTEFKLTQYEKLETLITLVDNVWTLTDSITNPSNETRIRENFVKFHIRSFIQFFNEPNEKIRDGVPFAFLSTAIGIHNVSKLIEISELQEKSESDKVRLKWLRIHELGKVIHSIFNYTTQAFLDYEQSPEPNVNFMEDLLEFENEEYQLLSIEKKKQSETKLGFTYREIAMLLDEELTVNQENPTHALRNLLHLLVNMKQSNVNTKEEINFFCFGNNDYGVIPDLLDIVSDSGLYLVMADMKTMLLDLYFMTLKTFLQIETTDVSEKRTKLWNDMQDRINKKIDFPYLDGAGWENPAGPIEFKCDVPPKYGLSKLSHSQWGRNVTTGISPNASQTFAYDGPGGPMKPNSTLGYFDYRLPEIQAVGFDGTFQGYIESELALSPIGSCRDTCPNFNLKTPLCKSNPFHCPLYRNSHCKLGKNFNENEIGVCLAKKSCPHHAMKCRRTGREVQICHSTQPGKLYDWIMFDGKYMGRQMYREHEETPNCTGDLVTIGRERWEMENGVILNTPRYCELCLCTCITPYTPLETQYFDIQPIYSDIQNGKIVSAVKFVKEDNVIRLAVEQGNPKYRGFIDDSTLEWIKPLEFDKGNFEKTVPFGLNGFTKFNMDLVIGEAGTVVTGIKFEFNSTDQSIGIKMQSTPIQWPVQNPHEISLLPSESQWFEPLTSEQTREPVIFEDVGDPFQQTGPSMPDSVLNSYVEFQTTSYEKDLAQTVIPLFDTQQVHYHEGRRWLRGVGIMHKGKPGSGGFISPLILPATPYKLVQYYPKPIKEAY